MSLRFLLRRSLKTRVTLVSLGIFVLSLWTLSIYVSRMLQADMQRVLGEQQLQAVTVLATQLNIELKDRQEWLGQVASQIDAQLLAKPAALQAYLEQRMALRLMFNGGAWVAGLDGIAIADVPVPAQRLGVNYLGVDFIAAVLKDGKAIISSPTIGKARLAPIVAIAVPIRDVQGHVIGVLSGVIDLAKPNFMDKITQGLYGKTGGYLLVAPHHKRFVTATDRSRIMQATPDTGINPLFDRFMQGHDGYGIAVSSRGIEELYAAKNIPAAGWFLAAEIPTAEAFAPFYAMEKRMLLATLLLTLLAGALTQWTLRRQLAPLAATADAMAALADSNQISQPLPSTRADEIGRLITGFNRILSLWTQREVALLQSQQHLATTLNSIGDAVIASDVAGRVTHMNPVAERLTGWTLSQALGLPLAEVFRVVNATTHIPLPDPVQRVMAQSPVLGLATHKALLAKDGKEYQITENAAPIRNAAGAISGVVLVFSDVTEKCLAEAALRIAATAFESQQGMFITNAQSVILRVNNAFAQITGYSAKDAVGQNPRLLRSGRHDSAFYAAMMQALKSEGAWGGEIWNRRKSGEVYPEWMNISAVKDGAGQTSHYVAIFSDISQHHRAQLQIDTLAFYDPLTHLPNRRLLLDRLEQALQASTRHARKNALLFVDLDNFKTLNDTLGHKQGDLLLAQVAQRLKLCIRDGDTLARLGSDEFVLMLEDLSEDIIEAAVQVEAVGERILDAFVPDFTLADGAHHATPSIGTSLFGGAVLESSEQPLKRAELAMFQAKAAGRNTLRFFEARMQAEVSARAALEADLHRALHEQQFLLYYQPQVLGNGSITGVEALVRWQHPQRGMVSPAEFIPLAEETGLILPLGQWVLETACLQLAAWAKQAAMEHLTMSVNVSAHQFKQRNFVESVLSTLKRTQANPKRLKLELTESMLVDDVEGIITKMDEIKAQGVGFSLDDFGTGYSSLASLKRLPLDQLKIDQAFVRNIVTDPNDVAIARMVVALGESMGLSVIAEGVEQQAQADLLAHHGCHAYQGYFFSRPLPLAALEAFVMQR